MELTIHGLELKYLAKKSIISVLVASKKITEANMINKVWNRHFLGESTKLKIHLPISNGIQFDIRQLRDNMVLRSSPFKVKALSKFFLLR